MDTANEVQTADFSETRDEELRTVRDQLRASERLVAELRASRRRSRVFGTFLSALIAAISFTIAAFLLASVMLNIGIFP